ncbi:hypothetical protein ACF0H5_006365 [Mactra antiquata]
MNLIRSEYVASLQGCYRLCKSLSICKSITYGMETCSLHSVDSSQVTSADFISENGFMFSDISEWPINPSDTCEGNPCGEDRCFRLGESYTCKTLESCHYYKLSLGKKNDTSTKVGTYVKLTCTEPGFKLIGNVVIHCQRNGFWSDYSFCGPGKLHT